jgi:hypothetical protein
VLGTVGSLMEEVIGNGLKGATVSVVSKVSLVVIRDWPKIVAWLPARTRNTDFPASVKSRLRMIGQARS